MLMHSCVWQMLLRGGRHCTLPGPAIRVEHWRVAQQHGDPEKPELLAYYVKNGVVAAAAGLGRDRDTSALVALMSIRRDRGGTWRVTSGPAR
jgi:hypothetical protein